MLQLGHIQLTVSLIQYELLSKCSILNNECILNDDEIHIIRRLDNYSKYGYEGIEKSKIELY